MAHEILSVKLCELENQLSRLSSRIYLSETAGNERLQQEIQTFAEALSVSVHSRRCGELFYAFDIFVRRAKINFCQTSCYRLTILKYCDKIITVEKPNPTHYVWR